MGDERFLRHFLLNVCCRLHQFAKDARRIGDSRCFGQLLCSIWLVFDHQRPGYREWLSRLRDRIRFPIVLEWSSPRSCFVWFRFVFPYFSAPDVLVAGPGISASDPYLFREGRH